MFRPRPATLTLVLLALASGCKSTEPGSASNSAVDRKSEERKQAVSPTAADDSTAAEPAAGSVPPPAPEAEAAKPTVAKESPGDAIADSRIEVAEPMISGGLDRDIIRRKVLDQELDIRACAPELAGTVVVKLAVDDRGVVKDVELGKDSDLDDREAVDCILALMSKWSFVGEASAKASVELRVELK
jgi:hypothetical protein